MACDLDLESEISRFDSEIENIEAELRKYNERYAKLRMDHERLILREDVEESKKSEHEMRLNEAWGIMENLEENLEYSRGRQRDLVSERRFDLDAELLYNKSYDSMEAMRRFLKLFLGKTGVIIKEQLKDKEGINQLGAQLESAHLAIE